MTFDLFVVTVRNKLHHDCRDLQLSRPAVVYDTGKTALYGHGFVTPHVAILGFGDGSVQVRF